MVIKKRATGWLTAVITYPIFKALEREQDRFSAQDIFFQRGLLQGSLRKGAGPRED